jgi:hypothetical protein
MPPEKDEFFDFSEQLTGALKEYLEYETKATVNPAISKVINSNSQVFSGLTQVKKYVPQMSPFEKEKLKKEEEKENKENVGDKALIKAKNAVKEKSKKTKKENEQKAEAEKQNRAIKQNVGEGNKQQPTYKPNGEQ